MLKNKKNEICRGTWLVLAVLLVFGGILSLVTPAGTRPHLAFTFGLIMALSALGCFLVYALQHSEPLGAEWILADGLVALSLCGQVSRDQWIAFAMGAWLLFSGVTKWISLVLLKRNKVKNWGLMAAPGGALMVFGLISQYVFVDPAYSGLFMGLAFLLQGAHFGFLWWFWSQMAKEEE